MQKTGITLAKHPLTKPLAVQLQSCDFVDSINTRLLGQAQPFSNFPESDMITQSIKTTVSISNRLSVANSLADAFGLVCQNVLIAAVISDWFIQTFPPAKAIQADLAILTCCMCRSLVHMEISL